jgi:hypothetical protein
VTLLFFFFLMMMTFYHSLSVCCPNRSQILCLRGQKLKYGNVPLRHLVLSSKESFSNLITSLTSQLLGGNIPKDTDKTLAPVVVR